MESNNCNSRSILVCPRSYIDLVCLKEWYKETKGASDAAQRRPEVKQQQQQEAQQNKKQERFVVAFSSRLGLRVEG